MKLSIIALFGILPVISADCIEKVDTAQKCLSDCVSAPSSGGLDANGNIYGNKLVECLDQDFTTDIALNLEACCNMSDAECDGSFSEATQCLNSELSRVQEAGTGYLTCIAEKYSDKTCAFATFCVNILTGGYGTNITIDFGAEKLAADMAGATTCEDPTVTTFGYNVCHELSGCCPACVEPLAGLANAVAEVFLGTGEECDTSCAAYMLSSRRNLAEMVGPTTIDVQNTELATTLASECVDTLATDIVLYNETVAVSNHFDCLTKKMGKIAAEMDDRAQESSSISLSFGRITALSMIASVVYSAIA